MDRCASWPLARIEVHRTVLYIVRTLTFKEGKTKNGLVCLFAVLSKSSGPHIKAKVSPTDYAVPQTPLKHKIVLAESVANLSNGEFLISNSLFFTNKKKEFYKYV
nr:hypothetical protein [Grifola frondosa]